MVPIGDEVAEKRFNSGVHSTAQFIRNMIDRRKHRIPKKDTDYKIKEAYLGKQK